MIGLVVVLVLALLGIGGWAYGTGRLGFGPLSAKDEAAAKVIAAGVDGPAWADDDQRSCAATALLHDHRAGDLADVRLIKPGGPDGWTFTGHWRTAEATTYAEGLLDCAKDWKEQLADAWRLDDTSCLDRVGRSTVATTLITTELGLDSPEATKAHDAAAERLDQCYRTGLANPTGTAEPAYRAVDFSFTVPNAANGESSLTVDGPDGTDHVSGTTYHAETDEGGKRICIRATLEATYGWGSTRSTSTRVCGKAEPKRLWWAKLPSCTEFSGCVVWALHAAGFRSGFADLRITGSDGTCPFVSGDCRKDALIGGDGRGLDHGYVLRVTGGPGKRNDIIARMGGLTARLPR